MEPGDPGSITGRIGFRILFDDATNIATTAVSVDGGATWTIPFAGAEIFVGRSAAQFILSADPSIAGGVVTTTTTVASSTTTTTTTLAPPMACDPTGCFGGARAGSGRLFVTYRARADKPAKERLAWKLRKGEAGSAFGFGTPTKDTTYEFCVGDGGPAPLLDVVIPPDIRCDAKPCWKRSAKRSFVYSDPDGLLGGVRGVVLDYRNGDMAKLGVFANGPGSTPPLPLNVPLTVRLSTSEGTCWATTFSDVGMRRNSAERVKARSD